MRRKNKLSLIIAIGLIIFIVSFVGIFWLLKAVNNFFEHNEFVFNRPVEVQFNPPIQIKERIVRVEQIVQVIEEVPELEGLNDIEKYICDKWGVYDCKTAIAVARAESDIREEAINVNKNGTVDVGIFQINSVHFKKEGCSLKKIVNAKQNIDCAYKIYQDQGWTPWVAFKNNSFKIHLKGGDK